VDDYCKCAEGSVLVGGACKLTAACQVNRELLQKYFFDLN